MPKRRPSRAQILLTARCQLWHLEMGWDLVERQANEAARERMYKLIDKRLNREGWVWVQELRCWYRKENIRKLRHLTAAI